ncbi:MAG: anti-sigma factor [Granulosicoccus sp.]
MSVDWKPNIDLHAFADGELDAQASERVRAAMEADPELFRQYQAIKHLKEQLVNEIGAQESREIPEALVNTVRHFPHTQKSTSDRSVAWVAAACLFAGLAGGFLWGSSSNSGKGQQTAEAEWVEQVANYHAMYTLDTLAHVKTTDDEKAAMLGQIRSAIGQTLVIPEFPGSSLEFKRGQVLTSGGQTVIQLAFLDVDSGTPIAVCFTPANPVSASETLRYGVAFDVNYVNWQTSELDVLVVGNYKDDLLEQLAASVQSQFAGI